MNLQNELEQGVVRGNVMDLLLDMVCAVNEEGLIVYVSAACERILGYQPAEMTGKPMLDFVHPADRESTRATARQVMRGESLSHFENRYVHRDGRSVTLLWSSRWLPEERLRLGVGKDVSELKQAQRIQAAMHRISEAVHQTEDLGELCRQLHDIVAELLPIRRIVLMLSADQSTHVSRIPSEAQDSGAHGVECLLSPLIANDREIGQFIIERLPGPDAMEVNDELLQFISIQIGSAVARKLQEQQLRHRAHHDALTGVSNRFLFETRFDAALQRARDHDEQVAILYIDLIGFKAINDRLGHQAGDEVLCQVAERLSACVRQSDTVGRPGGDEFTVLLNDVSGPEAVQTVIGKIHRCMEQGFPVQDGEVHLSLSIGTALYPDDGEDRGTLYQVADHAMYASRGSRRG